MQLGRGGRRHLLRLVSILIRPSGRMQPGWSGFLHGAHWFQSSSDLQAGCNVSGSMDAIVPFQFQSSSDLQAGCNGPEKAFDTQSAGFNPHPTFRPDATCPCALATSATWMFQSSSDLQAGCNTNQAGKYGSVSLFQSSSDLQAGCNPSSASSTASCLKKFQSSSDLQAGCNPARGSFRTSGRRFQSSSDLQAGCNPARGSFRTSGRRFQSSSDLQAGCNKASLVLVTSCSLFQSSSDLQAGCNWRGHGRCRGLHVSILIRPSGRMQPVGVLGVDHSIVVSILIRPSGRMQLGWSGMLAP